MADIGMFVDVPWTTQPQGPVEIDWSNPLTKGLYFTTGPKIDFYNYTNRNAVTNGVSEAGTGPIFTASSSQVLYQFISKYPKYQSYGVFSGFYTTGHSVLVLGSTGAITGSKRTLFGVSTPYDRMIGITAAATTNSFEYEAYGSANRVIATSSFTSDYNTHCVIGVSYPYPTNWHGVYVDGVLGMANTGYAGNDPGVSYSLIGSRLASGDFGDYHNGQVLLVIQWNRNLSDAEVRSLSANPWQIFEPRKVLVSYIPKSPWSMRETKMRGTDTTIEYTPPSTVAANPKIIRSSQPQYTSEIDGGNPITRNLIVAINAAVLPPHFIKTNATYTIGSGGLCLVRNSTTTKVYDPSVRVIPGTNDFTIFGLALNRSNNTVQGIASGRPGGIGATSMSLAYLNNNIYLNAYGGSLVQTRSNPHIIGRMELVIATRRSGIVFFYVNGIFAGSAIQTANFNSSDGFGVEGNNSQSEVYLNGFFNRSLSDAEIKSLSDNPWQIFKSNQQLIWGGK